MSSKSVSASKLEAKAAQTRARLIEVALELMAAQEFHRASLDAIAAKAGVTKGAIYGHFESKDALLLAAFFSKPMTRPETIDWPSGRVGSVRERLRKLGEAVVKRQREMGAGGAAMTAEFMLYALTHESLRARVNDTLLQGNAAMERHILALFAPEELPMPVPSFALMLGSLIPGLMFRRAYNGGRANRETVLAIFEGLAGS